MRCNSNALTSWEPIQRIRRDFESQMGLQPVRTSAALSIVESADSVIVAVDLPGVAEKDVTVTVHDGHLVIAGERQAVAETDDARTVYNTRRFGEFGRTLRLHDSVDPDSVDAILQDGVLTITLQRRPESQPRTVNVRAAH